MEIKAVDYSEDNRLRILSDIVKRSKPGVWFYPIVWFLIAVDTDIHQKNALLFLLGSLYFIMTALIRFYYLASFSKQAPEQLDSWADKLPWYVVPQPFGWGVLFSISMFSEMPNFELFMAFSTAGICAGGANTLAPDKKLSIIFVISFLIPPMIMGFIAPDRWVLSIMVLLFFIFIMGVSRNQNREYWQALSNETKLVKLSNTDPLTKLFNRRSFDEKLNELCHLSSRAHELLSLAVIDIDHFKKINDMHGHVIGDECLKAISNTLASCLTRTTDSCSRYGGEEFCVILPGTDSEGAKKVCERLRTRIEQQLIKTKNKTLNLKVSIGCVTQRIQKFQNNLPETLFMQADKALYEAKEQGRNRCVYFEFDPKSENYRQMT